ncbi:MAG: YajQ family cyclic di-GMP-binding protein [Proteobacteria bacterium]|nr:YajQ family cyclic di-GMP-binding protein [Pseudomonadota bacterium]
MPSFDIVLKTDLQEVDNAINQAQKELGQRYDFKGSKSKIDWDKKNEVSVVGDDEYKLKAVIEILEGKFAKRGISLKNLTYSKIEPSFEGTVRQKVTLAQGIPAEKAKEINRLIKDSKIKVSSQHQDEQVRVTGKKRDDLQEAIALVKKAELGLDFQFQNFRD